MGAGNYTILVHDISGKQIEASFPFELVAGTSDDQGDDGSVGDDGDSEAGTGGDDDDSDPCSNPLAAALLPSCRSSPPPVIPSPPQMAPPPAALLSINFSHSNINEPWLRRRDNVTVMWEGFADRGVERLSAKIVLRVGDGKPWARDVDLFTAFRDVSVAEGRANFVVPSLLIPRTTYYFSLFDSSDRHATRVMFQFQVVPRNISNDAVDLGDGDDGGGIHYPDDDNDSDDYNTTGTNSSNPIDHEDDEDDREVYFASCAAAEWSCSTSCMPLRPITNKCEMRNHLHAGVYSRCKCALAKRCSWTACGEVCADGYHPTATSRFGCGLSGDGMKTRCCRGEAASTESAANITSELDSDEGCPWWDLRCGNPSSHGNGWTLDGLLNANLNGTLQAGTNTGDANVTTLTVNVSAALEVVTNLREDILESIATVLGRNRSQDYWRSATALARGNELEHDGGAESIVAEVVEKLPTLLFETPKFSNGVESATIAKRAAGAIWRLRNFSDVTNVLGVLEKNATTARDALRDLCHGPERNGRRWSEVEEGTAVAVTDAVNELLGASKDWSSEDANDIGPLLDRMNSTKIAGLRDEVFEQSEAVKYVNGEQMAHLGQRLLDARPRAVHALLSKINGTALEDGVMRGLSHFGKWDSKNDSPARAILGRLVQNDTFGSLDKWDADHLQNIGTLIVAMRPDEIAEISSETLAGAPDTVMHMKGAIIGSLAGKISTINPGHISRILGAVNSSELLTAIPGLASWQASQWDESSAIAVTAELKRPALLGNVTQWNIEVLDYLGGLMGYALIGELDHLPRRTLREGFDRLRYAAAWSGDDAKRLADTAIDNAGLDLEAGGNRTAADRVVRALGRLVSGLNATSLVAVAASVIDLDSDEFFNTSFVGNNDAFSAACDTVWSKLERMPKYRARHLLTNANRTGYVPNDIHEWSSSNMDRLGVLFRGLEGTEIEKVSDDALAGTNVTSFIDRDQISILRTKLATMAPGNAASFLANVNVSAVARAIDDLGDEPTWKELAVHATAALYGEFVKRSDVLGNPANWTHPKLSKLGYLINALDADDIEQVEASEVENAIRDFAPKLTGRKAGQLAKTMNALRPIAAAALVGNCTQDALLDGALHGLGKYGGWKGRIARSIIEAAIEHGPDVLGPPGNWTQINTTALGTLMGYVADDIINEVPIDSLVAAGDNIRGEQLIGLARRLAWTRSNETLSLISAVNASVVSNTTESLGKQVGWKRSVAKHILETIMDANQAGIAFDEPGDLARIGALAAGLDPDTLDAISSVVFTGLNATAIDSMEEEQIAALRTEAVDALGEVAKKALVGTKLSALVDPAARVAAVCFNKDKECPAAVVDLAIVISQRSAGADGERDSTRQLLAEYDMDITHTSEADAAEAVLRSSLDAAGLDASDMERLTTRACVPQDECRQGEYITTIRFYASDEDTATQAVAAFESVEANSETDANAGIIILGRVGLTPPPEGDGGNDTLYIAIGGGAAGLAFAFVLGLMRKRGQQNPGGSLAMRATSDTFSDYDVTNPVYSDNGKEVWV